jgi:hypothetical protein
VAMSTGRKWKKEIYVGFLLFLLSFLYLSHLTQQFQPAQANVAAKPISTPVEQASQIFHK